MNKKFIVEISSDLEYNEMVAYISCEEVNIALITQEKGIDHMEIEIFPPVEGLLSWKFFLDDLLNVIQSAKEALWKIKKTS